MNIFKVVIYPALKKNFFDLLYNINCNAREYIGCTDVDRYFDIEKVEREEFVNVGLGVMISKPVVVEKGFKGGLNMFSSLSHNGVLATYYNVSGHKYQLTDLVDERQIEIKVWEETQTGFYDNSMVALTLGRRLSVCLVENIFLKKKVSVLKRIGSVKVNPLTDVSLLHSTRVLIFKSTSDIPHEFNVDTGVIKKLNFGKKIWAFASLTGIDVGVKGVFVEWGNNIFSYSLNNDNSISLLLKQNSGILYTFIPSSSDPKDLRMGMKAYDDENFFTNTTEEAQLITPFEHHYNQSIVRLYQNIFLVYDAGTKRWCLVKILVP